MLLTTELHPDMGAKVISHLKKLEKLPTSGFIAGQSVLSALLALYGKGHVGPINDIDIYTNDRKARPRVKNMSFNPDQLQIGFVKPSEEDLRSRHYDGVTKFFNVKKITLFRISDVSYKGLLNIIKIKNYNESFDVTPHQILESFDLNLVKVGVSLADRKLYWTLDFDFFVRTGQMEVTTPNSVFHTVCRATKKMAEMPWLYTNQELNFKTLLLPQAVYKQFHNKEFSPYEKFGKKYLELYNKHPVLQDLFDIKKIENKKKEDKVELYTCSYKDEFLSAIDKSEIETHVKLLSDNFQASQVYMGAMALSKQLVNRMYLRKGKHYEYARKIITPVTPYSHSQVELLDQVYLDGQVQSEWSERIDKLIKKHKSLSYLFTGYSLDIQTKIYNNIKKLESEFGEYVIGLLETNTFTAEDLINFTVLHTHIQKYHSEQSLPFENFIPLPSYKHGDVQITDLKSKLEISAEGAEMHHCVGGYADSVKVGRVRILSLRSNTDRSIKSTAEIHPISGYKLAAFGLSTDGEHDNFRCPIHVAQHRSFANGMPHDSHLEALRVYVAEHNAKYFKHIEDIYPLEKALHDRLSTFQQTFNIPKNGKIIEYLLRPMNVNDLMSTYLASNDSNIDSAPVGGMELYSKSTHSMYFLFFRKESNYLDSKKNELVLKVPNEYYAQRLQELENNATSPRKYNLSEQIGYMIFNHVRDLQLLDLPVNSAS